MNTLYEMGEGMVTIYRLLRLFFYVVVDTIKGNGCYE